MRPRGAEGFRDAGMILFDTNFLIASLVRGSAEDAQFREWLVAEQKVTINVIVWAEFLCGPVSDEDVRLASALFPQPEPVLADDSVRAAQLYNATGRRRGSLADCLIAATSIRLNTELATKNLDDFRSFEPMGLRLARTVG